MRICTPISFCGKRGGLLGRSFFLKGGVLAAPSFVFSPGVKGEALRFFLPLASVRFAVRSRPADGCVVPYSLFRPLGALRRLRS